MLYDNYLILLFCLGTCASYVTISAFNKDLEYENNRPVIGVLAQEIESELDHQWPGVYKSCIAGSYVKLIEGGGGRAVPIWIGRPKSYYDKMMTKVNGILFTGGGLNLTDSSEKHEYPEAAEHIFNIAKNLNDNGVYFPLFGICLGLQTMLYISNDKKNCLASCSAYKQSMPLNFAEDYETSRIFGSTPAQIIEILRNEPIMPHFHYFCFTPQNLTQYDLDNEWRPLSYNTDNIGLEFISTVEHKRYPFYGVQYHPEKPLYEWGPSCKISHTKAAISAAQYFGLFFVNEARKNENGFANIDEETRMMIYNYPLTFTYRAVTPNEHADYQVYLFKANDDYL